MLIPSPSSTGSSGSSSSSSSIGGVIGVSGYSGVIGYYSSSLGIWVTKLIPVNLNNDISSWIINLWYISRINDLKCVLLEESVVQP